MSNIETCKKCEIERTKETTTKYPEGLDWLSRAILDRASETDTPATSEPSEWESLDERIEERLTENKHLKGLLCALLSEEPEGVKTSNENPEGMTRSDHSQRMADLIRVARWDLKTEGALLTRVSIIAREILEVEGIEWRRTSIAEDDRERILECERALDEIYTGFDALIEAVDEIKTIFNYEVRKK